MGSTNQPPESVNCHYILPFTFQCFGIPFRHEPGKGSIAFSFSALALIGGGGSFFMRMTEREGRSREREKRNVAFAGSELFDLTRLKVAQISRQLKEH